MPIELIPLCTVAATVGEQSFLPSGPMGTRVIADISDARVEGERVRGRLKGHAAADWLYIAADGTGTPDVRATIETDDGAVVFVSYQGRFDASVPFGEAPIYTAPRFETGDERYAWLNKVQAVAKGHFDGQTVTYEMYELR